MKESQLQDLIRLAVTETNPSIVLWRNNCGVADVRGAKIRFGVGGPGAADLLGLCNGRFLAVEIKTPIGRQSNEQQTFQRLVEMRGGIYKVLRSVEEARAWAGAL